MTAISSFNIMNEPWIEVLDVEGRPRVVSIKEVFRESPRLRNIAGELPTQDAAILRLLLAILHRALPVDGDDEVIRRTWGRWWSARTLPMPTIDRYLDDWTDRFDLLDPTRPFFQVADLHTASGHTSGLSALIGDLPVGHKFFTTRAGDGVAALSLAEATRWLVHCQAFDPSGIKSGAVGDDRVKGGRGYPIGTGWAGNLGLIIVEGETLVETLLLNLVLTTRSHDEDLPPWEAADWSAATSGREIPRGPADALTWQSRRVRLHVQDGHVVDALVSNGDRIRVRNQDNVETMSGWRRSAPQEKKHGEEPVYLPRTHNPERAIWRGLASLIAASDVVMGRRTGAQTLIAANVSWVGDLRAHEQVDPDAAVTLHTVGVQYGTHNAFIEAVISDRLTLHAEILHAPELQDCAQRAVRIVDAVVQRIGVLAANLARASGRDGDGDRSRAMEQCLQRFDPVYRSWLIDLTSTSLEDHEATWRHRARGLALAMGEEMLMAAPRLALRGRVVTDRNNKQILLDAALAHRRFVHQILSDIPKNDNNQPIPHEESA